MKKLSVFVAAMATVASMGTAVAAADGSSGETSEGNFKVYYSKGTQIQVWGFEDVFFAAAESRKEHSEAMSLCAISSSGNVRFKVDSRFYMDDDEDKGAYSITIADKDEGGMEDTWGDGGLAANVYGAGLFGARAGLANGATTDTCDTDYQVAKLTVNLDDHDLDDGFYYQLVTVTAFPI